VQKPFKEGEYIALLSNIIQARTNLPRAATLAYFAAALGTRKHARSAPGSQQQLK